MFYALRERGFGERVIQVHRHFAAEKRGVIHERTGHARRQINSHHLLIAPDFFEAASEKYGSRQGAAKIYSTARHVGKSEAKWMLARHGNQVAMQRLHLLATQGPRGDLQLLHRFAHGKRRGGGGQRCTKTHGDRMRQTRGDEMDEFSAPITHRSAQHAIKRDGNDGRVHVFHDVLDAAPERQKLADARNLALGKDADDFAIADGIARFFQRVEQFAWPLFGRDRNGFPDFGEWFHPPFFVDALEHQKADWPVGGGDEKHRVGH